MSTLSSLDEDLLTVTSATVTILSGAEVILGCLSILSSIRARGTVGRGLAALLVSTTAADLLLTPGGLAVIPIIQGWTALSQRALLATVVLRDMSLMVVSVVQAVTLVVICAQQYPLTPGSKVKVLSGKIAVVISVVIWLYAALLFGAVILRYGFDMKGVYGHAPILLLPLAWLPAGFLQGWYAVNILLASLAAIIMAVLTLIRSKNSVESLTEDMKAENQVPPPKATPGLSLVLVVLNIIIWLPYAAFTCSTAVNILVFEYRWIHVYHVWYVLAIIGACVRMPLLCAVSPGYRKALLATLKCRCTT